MKILVCKPTLWYLADPETLVEDKDPLRGMAALIGDEPQKIQLVDNWDTIVSPGEHNK